MRTLQEMDRGEPMNKNQMKKQLLWLMANHVFSDVFDIEYGDNFDGNVTEATLARWERVQRELMSEFRRRSR